MATVFRTATRATRSARARPILRQLRCESTAASTTTSTSGSNSSQALIGGLAGGSLVFLGGYAYYHFSGAKTIVNTAHKTKQTLQSYATQFQSSTPDFEPNQAIEWLRSTAKSYGAFIPGASSYIDGAFNDIDAIRQKHGKEVDNIVKEAYGELKDISTKQGLTIDSASKSWEALQKHLQKIADLAGDAGQDILNNHPALKEKVGGDLDQLKQLGEKYGPEAKKQVEETIDQVKDIMKQGMRIDSIPKVQSLLQEKVQKVREMGEKLWEKGMEQAKPFLDKSPQVKQVVEENVDALKKSGNVQELYGKIKEAVNSGSTDNLKKYVDKVRQGASSGSNSNSGSLQDYLKIIPGGSQVLPKLSQIQELAQEHGQEAEKIATDAFKEIEDVLKRKLEEAQALVNNAAKGKKGKD